MRPKTDILIIVFFLLAIAGYANSAEKVAQASQEPIRPIKVMVVKKNAEESQAIYPGRVQAGRQVNLSFRVPGPLIKLPVKPGQNVQKGDLIAEIDPRDFNTNLSAAEAAYDDALKSHNRYGRLFSKGAVSKSAYDSSKSAYLQAKAGLDQAKAALNDTKLYAPFSGTIAKTYVENHQDIQAKQPIAELQTTSQLEVTVQVPERDVLLGGDPKSYILSVRLDALPEREFPAEIKEFNTEADSATQTFAATVTIWRHDDLHVFPGMTAALIVRRNGKAAKDASTFLVPVESVLVDENRDSFVWKLNQEDSRVVKVPVKVVELTGSCIRVVEGLNDGDVIATAGVHHLHDGQKVSIFKKNQERCD